MYLKIVEESHRRAHQALVQLFRRIGVLDTETAASHEGISAVGITAFDGAEHQFLLRTKHLSGGAYTSSDARFTNHQELHWSNLLLNKHFHFQCFFHSRADIKRFVKPRVRVVS